MINSGIDWLSALIAGIAVIHLQFPGCTDFSLPCLSKPITTIPDWIMPIIKPVLLKF
jgi:hypothetical protein